VTVSTSTYMLLVKYFADCKRKYDESDPAPRLTIYKNNQLLYTKINWQIAFLTRQLLTKI